MKVYINKNMWHYQINNIVFPNTLKKVINKGNVGNYFWLTFGSLIFFPIFLPYICFVQY
jgi:hypothetical protein